MYKLLLPLLIIQLLLAGCSDRPGYNDPVPTHDQFTIPSEYVSEERVINVWTPPGYAENKQTYPVLYMPDGGIKEDFPHIANTLAKLTGEGKMAPHILVGIENTERGRDMTGFSEVEDDQQYCPLTDGAKDFRAFILRELVPEINDRYRTRDRKGIVGESLAGLFVTETFLINPGSFDFYIAMDPSLWWNDHYLVRKADSLLAKLPPQQISLWFAGSDAEDISRYTKMLDVSLQRSAPPNLRWKYSDQPNEQHHTIFRATKEAAFTWSMRPLNHD